MSDRVILGAVEGGGSLHVDVPTLVRTRALITGNSGAGKSRLLRRLAEQAFGKAQIILIDPEGEFATLRERHAFLLAGRAGEVPAEPRAAALLARRLMELRVSAVLDLYDLRLPEQREFVRIFLDALMGLDKRLYRETLVLIDEAHRFAPERTAGEAESTDAVIALMSQGRKRGLCGIPATQRLSKLHKDAAAEGNNVFVGRTVLDVDQKRAGDALGLSSAADRLALRDLENGTFLAFGPALDVKGVVTFRGGDVKTTHPTAGQRQRGGGETATPDAIKGLVAELKDLPEQAAEEIRTLQAAQARVRELERDLRAAKKAAPSPPPPPKAPKVVERSILRTSHIKALEGALSRMDRQADKIAAQAQRLIDLHADVRARQADMRAAIGRAINAPPPPPPAGRGIAALIPDGPGRVSTEDGTVSIATRPRRAAPGDSATTIGGGERAVLIAIAQHDAVTREQLSVLTGYKRSSRDTYLQRLRAAGLIRDGAPGCIVATEAGVAALGPSFTPLPTGDSLRAHWLGRLPEGERRIFEVVAAAYPNTVEREAISAATGYKRSSRDTYLQRLGARRLIASGRGGEVRAADELFG